MICLSCLLFRMLLLMELLFIYCNLPLYSSNYSTYALCTLRLLYFHACHCTVSLHFLIFQTHLSAADYVGGVVSSIEPIGVINSSIGEKPKNTTGKSLFYFSY